MSPTLYSGAYLLVKQKKRYQLQDIVQVKHPEYGKIVKRIISGNEDVGYYLAGDNVASVSTEQMGVIFSSDVVGKITMIINPPSPR